MPSRYATIITDDDGREVVSAIGQFEGAAPQARIGRIEAVPAGVLIGMVRGGPVDAAGGFGFPEKLGSGGVNLVRARLKALPEAARPEAARRKPKAKPAGKRAKSRKKPTRKTAAKADTAAKPDIAAPAGTAE